VLAWVWLALSAASFALVARAGEADLLRRFGSEYQQYQRAVPMFLPRLRPHRPHERTGPPRE